MSLDSIYIIVLILIEAIMLPIIFIVKDKTIGMAFSHLNMFLIGVWDIIGYTFLHASLTVFIIGIIILLYDFVLTLTDILNSR